MTEKAGSDYESKENLAALQDNKIELDEFEAEYMKKESEVKDI